MPTMFTPRQAIVNEATLSKTLLHQLICTAHDISYEEIEAKIESIKFHLALMQNDIDAGKYREE